MFVVTGRRVDYACLCLFALDFCIQSLSRVSAVPFSAEPQFRAVKIAFTASSYRVLHYPGIVRGGQFSTVIVT